jgi:hypothetical protein
MELKHVCRFVGTFDTIAIPCSKPMFKENLCKQHLYIRNELLRSHENERLRKSGVNFFAVLPRELLSYIIGNVVQSEGFFVGRGDKVVACKNQFRTVRCLNKQIYKMCYTPKIFAMALHAFVKHHRNDYSRLEVALKCSYVDGPRFKLEHFVCGVVRHIKTLPKVLVVLLPDECFLRLAALLDVLVEKYGQDKNKLLKRDVTSKLCEILSLKLRCDLDLNTLLTNIKERRPFITYSRVDHTLAQNMEV